MVTGRPVHPRDVHATAHVLKLVYGLFGRRGEEGGKAGASSGPEVDLRERGSPQALILAPEQQLDLRRRGGMGASANHRAMSTFISKQRELHGQDEDYGTFKQAPRRQTGFAG